MKKQDLTRLRKVRMEQTPNGAIFETSDLEPLVEGEKVKFDPRDTKYYGLPYDESRAVVGIVGKVLHVGEPYLALGEGSTYEEQAANARNVRLQWAEVGYAEIKTNGLTLHAVDALPLSTGKLVKAGCGHMVSKSEQMSASLGTSCPDCYDKMSD